MMQGEFYAVNLSSIPPMLRYAADTITDLRNRLTETCRNADASAEAGGVWHSPRFVCSECGAAYVMSDYARFCPRCGRRVVE
jgi:rubrerythrin